MQDDLQQIFAEGGILARQIKGYHPRQAQQEMAQRIADTLASATVLVAEAGTGTGKTFAYLAPAILSGQKVFISTGTKNLQDQLFRRDLPTLRKALAVPFQAAILKGRGNYLCHHRLTLAEQDPLLLSQSDALRSLRDWSQSSKNGDLSESDLLDNQSNLWPRVTSTVDNCLGQQCPEYQQCFIVEARRRAQEADIVVINHHLLMSDFALKSAGQGEVLPTADAFIIDEAHQLPAIAGQFLGNRISSNQIVELCRDTVQEVQEHAADSKTLGLHAEKLQAKLQSLRLHIGNVEQRTPWLTQLFNDEIKNNFNELVDYLEVFESELEPLAVQSPGLSQCHVRAKELVNIIQLFSEQNDDNLVLWLDNRPTGFVLHATPFEISQHFQQWLEEKPAAWVFTSATLTVAGKFNHFCQHLGIENAEYASWESPFDYAKQSLLYLPNIPVEPSDRQYNQYVADIAREVILHSQGRIFLLFTSYRAGEWGESYLTGGVSTAW
jgi:ATP-dependent DNA helicase DinG